MNIHFSPLLTQLLPFLKPHTPSPVGSELAQIVSNIVDCEIQTGGPYRSWPREESSKVDFGFNLAIALFLRTLDVYLAPLEGYLGAMLTEGVVSSVYFDATEVESLIERYLACEPEQRTDSAVVWSVRERELVARIRSRMDSRLSKLSAQLKQDARNVMERTIQGNLDKQMTLMPFFMREALGDKGQVFSDDALAELGLANIFFWTAFIIYDDFWDEDEAAEPRYLPVANLFSRHYTSFFSTYPNDISFRKLFHQMMDTLDGANSWEITMCRMLREGSVLHIPENLPQYGDYGIKFYPAAGHVIGPVSMLMQLGYTKESAEVSGLVEYFRHYLVAMQLNDDAHDWKEDLERGHISTAIHLLLLSLKDTYPEKKVIRLQKDMRKLEQLFWFEVLPRLCTEILERTGKAQRALDSLSYIENPAPLQQFIDRNRKAAEQAFLEYERSIAFLEVIESAEKVQKDLISL